MIERFFLERVVECVAIILKEEMFILVTQLVLSNFYN